MNVLTMGADADFSVGATGMNLATARYAVEVARRQQQAERSEGAAAVRLIEAATSLIPQMTKTPDGHISVRA